MQTTLPSSAVIKQENTFRVNYPYLGLFGTADITLVADSSELTCKCKLLNGIVLVLKKNTASKKWIDVNIDRETPLSSVLGMSIEEYLKAAA